MNMWNTKKSSPKDSNLLIDLKDVTEEVLRNRESFGLIPKVRLNIQRLYDNDKEFCDECDVNRVRDEDWSVQRYLEYYDNDVDKATEELVSNLKWRKSFGVNTRTLAKDFGREFFNIGAIFVYNHDKNGIPLLISRGKCNRKIPKLQPMIEKYFIGIIEELDRQVGHKGFIFVLDCTDCTLSNLSMDLLKFVLTSIRVRYPLGLKYFIIYNMPWILRGIWKLVKGWLVEYEKLVFFANGIEILNYADIEQLPKYMGGNCEKVFTEAPEGCPSVYDVAQNYGLTLEEIIKHMKSYEDLLEEGDRLKENA